MKTKEEILNSYQATFALSKKSKAQIYLAMDEYNKELIDTIKEIQSLMNPCTQVYKKCEYILKNCFDDNKKNINTQVCEHPYNLVDVRLDGNVRWCYKCNCEF